MSYYNTVYRLTCPGDARANQHIFLTVMHTIWALFHNFVAEQLGQSHPHWSDNKMFEEARRIVVAVLQRVTYHEFLPELLNSRLMEKFHLWSGQGGRYDPQVWGSLMSEFSTAAYRVGHSFIPSDFGADLLTNSFFNPALLYSRTVGELVTDMANASSGRYDPRLVPAVTEFLYSRGQIGADLAAFNVFRGRDHGLRPYVEYLRLCTCRQVTRFDQLRSVMPLKAVNALRKLYK
ncbi:HPX6 [Cordylochernes scorpioides]|uniref:HPX6 n=1 Tax=Cordylochernes scorpioides TaxID=51811 RepID=A0ABY6K5E5_9ARAC|nr:HPX6 [Cordylochernes scorpioides]